MREIALTKGYVALVDDEDYEKLSCNKWTAVVTGKNIKRVYACRRCKGKFLLMHRVILSAAKGMDVDHINSNSLDNTKRNLRLATRSQNLANNRRKIGISGFRGVTRDPTCRTTPYGARLRDKLLGMFSTPEKAAAAYDQAARKEFGEFAKLNFPNGSP